MQHSVALTEHTVQKDAEHMAPVQSSQPAISSQRKPRAVEVLGL